MSLINNMLNELDKTKKDETAKLEISSSIKPISKNKTSVFRWKLVYWAIILIIAISAAWYYGPKINFNPSKTEVVLKTDSPDIKPEAADATQPTVPQTPATTLQNIVIEQKDNKTVLDFILSAPAQYYIERESEQQLSITINDTGLSGNIPVSLENSFIIALNTQQNNNHIVSTINLLPGTKIDELQLINQPLPHLHLVLSNPQLTKSSMSKMLAQTSEEEQELQRYHEIKQSLSQNKAESSIQKLHLFIGDFPNHLEARCLLVSMLIKVGRLQKADAVLEVGLDKHPEYMPFIKLKAYILVKQHNPEKAIKVLQKHLAPTNDIEYFSLLAALYQQEDHFMQAAEIYDQLTKIQPQKTTWWIGLGVALESAGKNNAAKEAYLRANNLADTTSELKTFLETKLKK